MKIVTDPVALGKVCTELEFIPSKKIADKMILWLRTDRRGKQVSEGAVGLACNQLGFDARVFLLKGASGRWDTFINPVITERSDETYITDEGCLSIPNKEFKIERSQKIVVVDGIGYDETKYTGRDAIVIQHEIDHLNGILISDKEK